MAAVLVHVPSARYVNRAPASTRHRPNSALMLGHISTLLIYPFSAVIDFRRQILTSKVDHRIERVKYL